MIALSKKMTAILARWLRLMLDTYPADTSRLIKQEGDRFVNPVGYTFRQETKALYQELLQGSNTSKLLSSLDNIIRIRAVQDFSASICHS